MDIYAGNSLLCYKTIFTVELVIAEILMCNRLPKRKLFVLRVVLCVLALLGISYVIPNNISNVWYNCSIFFAIFACSLCGIKICFQTTWRSVLFCGIAAYSAQHIVSQLFDLSIVLMNVPLDGSGTGYISSANSWLPIFTYGSGTMMIGENPFIIIVYFAILFFTYLLFYCLAKPSMEKNSEPQIKNVPIFCLAIVIVVVDIIISALISDYSAGKFDRFYLVFQILMNVFCCVLALYMQFTFAIVGKLENEVEILNRLREQEREQYAQTKETIDLINMKCHDLKHQIRKFGEASFVDTQTIKNIEKMITIYDTSVKTGNEVLDVILTEKRLYCSNYDINFDCIADGSALSFMSNEEIYTLFGNLVDNAVEAVCDLDEEKKIIYLSISASRMAVFIKIYNCYAGEITFKNGLPTTTKSNKRDHGFGMKSINMIVNKYDGEMTIDTDEGVFTLNIIFPLSNA